MALAETAQLVVNLNLRGDFREGIRRAQSEVSSFGTAVGRNATAPMNKLGTAATGVRAKLSGIARDPALKNSILQGVGLGGGLIGFQLLNTAVNQTVQYMGDAVTMASDLTEAQSKVDEVFEGSAPTVRRWASELDDAYGVSERNALKAAGTLGNFLTALGSTEEEAAGLSTQLVELAGDLASFNNTSIDEVLTALQSGIAGETEPMRRLGVDVSATRIEMELLERGIQKVNGEFTQNQKVMGRTIAIFEDTQKAQGDAIRTQDQYAGKQRQLNKNLDDFQTTIGTLLLPVLTDLSGVFVDLSSAAAGIASALPDMLGGLQEAIQPLNDFVGRDVGNDVANALRIISTGGLVLATDSLPAVGGAAEEAGKHLEGLIGESTDLGRAYDGLAGKGTLIGDVFGGIGDAIGGAINGTETLSGALERGSFVAADYATVLGDVDDSTQTATSSGQGLAAAFAKLTGNLGPAVQGLSDAVAELAAFQEQADEIAETRSLNKINAELAKQRRLRDEAAEAGRVAAFAEAEANIQRLQQERQLRQLGRKALEDFVARKNQEGAAQQLVTNKVAGTKREARELLAQTRKKYNVKVNVNDRQLAAAIAKAYELRAALGTLSANIGGAITGLFGRAEGGPVEAGRPYIVGEKRPELFVPNRDGYIYPRVPSGGGQVEVYVRPTLVVAAETVTRSTDKVVRTNRARVNAA